MFSIWQSVFRAVRLATDRDETLAVTLPSNYVARLRAVAEREDCSIDDRSWLSDQEPAEDLEAVTT